MAPGQQRLARLSERIYREFNSLLRALYRDDLLAVTATEARVTPDLCDVCIFVSILGDGESQGKKIFDSLIKKLPAIRKALFAKISLKHAPRITLQLDTSLTRGNRVVNLLDSIFNEK
jgi:ribosome-binding factor A